MTKLFLVMVSVDKSCAMTSTWRPRPGARARLVHSFFNN